jgi:predicted ATPase
VTGKQERERWAAAIKALGYSVHPGLSIIENLAQLIEGGALVERERCAKLVESRIPELRTRAEAVDQSGADSGHLDSRIITLQDAAKRIRKPTDSRKETR